MTRLWIVLALICLVACGGATPPPEDATEEWAEDDDLPLNNGDQD